MMLGGRVVMPRRYLKSGDNVGNQVILDDGDLILEQQFPLFQSGNLQLIARPGNGQGVDGGIKVAMFDPQHFKPLAQFLFAHS
jgi:hypothetical protein